MIPPLLTLATCACFVALSKCSLGVQLATGLTWPTFSSTSICLAFTCVATEQPSAILTSCSSSRVTTVEKMTRPKKWFLEKEGERVELACSDGLLKKPNANQTLGNICSISVPSEDSCGKYSVNEALMVSHYKCWIYITRIARLHV